MKCDFCSSPEPIWRFPCTDFEVAPKVISQSDWLACTECTALIRADEWKKLAQRGLLTDGAVTLRRMGVSENAILDQNLHLHRLFRQHRRIAAETLIG